MRRITSLLLVTTIVLVVSPMPAQAATCAAGQPDNEDEFRLTSIPSKMASDEGVIELRMGVKNISGSAAWYKTEFFVDTFDAGNLIQSMPAQQINNGAWGLFSYSWDPLQGHVGTRWLQQRTFRSPSNSPFTWTQVDWSSDGGEKIRIVDTIAGLTSPSYFTTAFVEPGRMNADANVLNSASAGAAYVYERVEEMAWLGIEQLVVAYPEYVAQGWGPYYPASALPDPVYPPGVTWPDTAFNNTPNFDLIGELLHAACVFDMRVAIGLGRGSKEWWNPALGAWDWLNPDVATQTDMYNEALDLGAVASDLYTRYGDNEYYGKAFWGFYNSFEANTFGGGHAMYFFDQVAQLVDPMGPEKPMIVSPSGTPTGISGSTLSNSKVDVFMYQDSVGAGYVDNRNACVPGCGAAYTNTYVPANRIGTVSGSGIAADLDVIFNEYETNHLGSGGVGTVKHIWSNTEAWRQANANDWQQSTGSCTYPNQLKTQLETERWHVGQMMVNEMFANFKSWRNTNAYIPTATGSAAWYTNYSIYWTNGAPNYTGWPALCP